MKGGIDCVLRYLLWRINLFLVDCLPVGSA